MHELELQQDVIVPFNIYSGSFVPMTSDSHRTI